MTCEIVRNGDHTTMIFCGHSRRQRCKFCHIGFVSKLCDFPVGHGKTCDAGMCAKCATNVAPNVDYCPTHRDQKPAQQNLFPGGCND